MRHTHAYIDPDWIALSGTAGLVEQDLLELVGNRRQQSRLSCRINVSNDVAGLVVRLAEAQGL